MLPSPEGTNDMAKTILITGATDGIGLQTAKTLAGRGHKILLHGRSKAKLEAAAAQIGGGCETYMADLSQMPQIEALAAEVLGKHDRLDAVINNAGVYKLPDPVTADGLDARFVVNTFAPYVLTNLLMPAIPKDGRIVNLSSAAQAPVDIAAMKGQRPIDDFPAYAQSKLALTIWSRVLARQLPEGPVVIAVNPGSLLASKMVKQGFGVAGNDLQIGADILSDLATAPEYANASGRYFDNDEGRFDAPHPAALDEGHSTEVMQAIVEMTDGLRAVS